MPEEDYSPSPVSPEVAAGLESIYNDGDGPAMDRLNQAHHPTWKKLLVGLTVFFGLLTLVSWLGFFLFQGTPSGFEGEGVSLAIEGTDAPEGGEVTEYLIRWKNGEDVALGTANLEIRLPAAFRVTESPMPIDGEAATWRIGTVGPGKDGSFSLKGQFLAPQGKAMDLQAILTYRPSDFNSEFQKVATKTVTITGSALTVATTGPDRILPGDKATLEITYRNEGTAALENIKVLAVLPDDFVLEGTEPIAAGEGREWPVAKLDPGEEGKITVTGSFAPGAEGERGLGAEIGLVAGDGSFMPQAAAEAKATVFKGDLVTSLVLNGQTTAQSIRFGETLRFAVTWKNTGTVAIEDVVLVAVIETTPEGQVVRWNELVDKAGGRRDGGRITWTKKQVPALARIDPDEGGALEFELPALPMPLTRTSDVDYRVTAGLEATIAKIGGERVDRTVKTAPIVARFLSDTFLDATARYFDRDNLPVGTGPLPPQVGEKTTYRVYWQIDNSLHELANLRLSARLPDNVIWTGYSSVDAGDLKFDAATSKMAWSLNWMPTGVKSLVVAFDVGLVPGDEQRGRPAGLLDASLLEATDKFTGAPILLTASPLTTALETDAGALGKAKVE